MPQPSPTDYQQLRRRLQQPRAHRVRSERTPEILSLPNPPDLTVGNLREWAHCLLNILPLPYQIVAFQTWIELYPELPPEQPFNSPRQILVAILEGDYEMEVNNHADMVIQDGITLNLDADSPSDRIRQRWNMLNRWWNTTLSHIPLLAEGIRMDPEILEGYRGALIAYIQSFEAEHAEQEVYFLTKATKLLLSLETDPEQVVRDWRRYNLPARQAAERLVAIGQFQPLESEEIHPLVIELFATTGTPSWNESQSYNTHHVLNLAAVSTPRAREDLLQLVTAQDVPINTIDRLSVIRQLWEMDPNLYSDELVDLVGELFPTTDLNHYNELRGLVRLLGTRETPRTREALLGLWNYQFSLWHDPQQPPKSYNADVTTDLIHTLGAFQNAESRKLYQSLGTNASDLNQLRYYVASLQLPEEIAMVREYLLSSLGDPTTDKPLDIAAAVKKLEGPENLDVVEQIARQWHTAQEHPDYRVLEAVQDRILETLGREAGEARLAELDIPGWPRSPSYFQYQRTRMPETVEEIETAIRYADEYSPPAYSNEAYQQLDQIYRLTEALRNKSFIPPSLTDLLIDIWKRRIDVNGDLINATRYIDMDLEPGETPDPESFEDAEIQEWLGEAFNIAHRFVSYVIDIGRQWPTPTSDQWLTHVSQLINDCYLWRKIVIDPVVFVDRWGDSVF